MESPYKGKTGLKRVWNAFRYSLEGFRAAYACEDAFRQEVWLAVILLPIAFVVPASGASRALMVGSVLFVLVAELLKARGLQVTRLARGVPVGSELEYVDLGTIAHALVERR